MTASAIDMPAFLSAKSCKVFPYAPRTWMLRRVACNRKKSRVRTT